MLLADIAKKLNLELIGDGNVEIFGVNSLNFVGNDQISFLRDKKYARLLDGKLPGAILLKSEHDVFESQFPRLYSKDPEFHFLKIVDIFHPDIDVTQDISGNASIHESVSLGLNCKIGSNAVIEQSSRLGSFCYIDSNVFIGKNVTIGDNVRLHPGVVIYNDCEIGNNVIIHANSVIGADGFGYLRRQGKQIKIKQLGNVVIGDDVEIGANTTIDSATFGSTIIESNAKIDNLVQIAHNCKVGESTAISAQVGLSGHTVIGKRCLIGGQVGFAGHLSIGDDTVIYAQSGVAKSFSNGSLVFGTPGKDFKQTKTEMMSIARLPRFFDRLKELEAKVRNLQD